MKTFTLALLVVFTMFLLVQNGQAQEPKKTIICGNISNFQQIKAFDFISISYHDLLGGYNYHSEHIKEDGAFRIELDLEYPTEFIFSYSMQLTYFMSPGDSLFFEITENLKSLRKLNYEDKLPFYKVTGTAQKVNEDMSQYQAYEYSKLRNGANQNIPLTWRAMTMEYRRIWEDNASEWREKNAFFNQQHNTCETFRTWVEKHTKYNAWYHMIGNTNVGPKYVDKYVKSIPDDYFSFIKDIDKFDITNLQSAHYHHFLNAYFKLKTLQVQAKIGDDFIMLKENDYAEYLNILKYEFMQEKNSCMRDILLSKLYSLYLDSIDYDIIKYSFDASGIDDKWLYEQIMDKFNKRYKIDLNPEVAVDSN